MVQAHEEKTNASSLIGPPSSVDDAGTVSAAADRVSVATAAALPAVNVLSGLAAKARDLEALRGAVVDAASVSAGLWFSYLFVCLYLAIAVGSVTHRDLFYESPVKLPFLNVDLPLVAFFVLGPGLFLVVHAYVLLHFGLLAAKTGIFHAELQAQVVDEAMRARLRRQLPSNIFVQALAGPREVRTGLSGLLFRLISQISLVAGPIALLVLFELQFLPYHHEAISWWHRACVVADLALLWAMWPSIARGETTSLRWADFRRPGVVAAAAATCLPLWLVFIVATFAGERLDDMRRAIWLVPDPLNPPTGSRWPSLHDLLVEGDVDFILRRPTSLWSNRLILPDLDLAEGGKPGSSALKPSLRGRRLEGAVLIDAKLLDADLTGSRLEKAHLNRADLRNSKLGCGASDLQAPPPAASAADRVTAADHPHAARSCTDLRFATLDGAILDGADLSGARMQSTSLIQASLVGANLADADLEQSSLDRASLRQANLSRAKLAKASLVQALLQGAILRDTDLSGASLNGAVMQATALSGVRLEDANLEAADLRGAQLMDVLLRRSSLESASLQGAMLLNVEFQGGLLRNARFDGATLSHPRMQLTNFIDASFRAAALLDAQLQGAEQLETADFTAAKLVRPFVWRARTALRASDAQVVDAQTSATQLSDECIGKSRMRELQPCAWTIETYRKIVELIAGAGWIDEARTAAQQQATKLDPDTPLEAEREMAETWRDLSDRVSTYPFGQGLGVLIQTGCNSGAVAVRGIIDTAGLRFGDDSGWRAALTTGFLDETGCPAARELTPEDKVRLRRIGEWRDSPAEEASPKQ